MLQLFRQCLLWLLVPLILAVAPAKPAKAGVFQCLEVVAPLDEASKVFEIAAKTSACASAATSDPLRALTIAAITAAGVGRAFSGSEDCENKINGVVGQLIAEAFLASPLTKDLFSAEQQGWLKQLIAGNEAVSLRDILNQIPAGELINSYITCGCAIGGSLDDMIEIGKEYEQNWDGCRKFVQDAVKAIDEFVAGGAEALHAAINGPPLEGGIQRETSCPTYYVPVGYWKPGRISTNQELDALQKSICGRTLCRDGTQILERTNDQGETESTCTASCPETENSFKPGGLCYSTDSYKAANGRCVKQAEEQCDCQPGQAVFEWGKCSPACKPGVEYYDKTEKRCTTCPAGANPVYETSNSSVGSCQQCPVGHSYNIASLKCECPPGKITQQFTFGGINYKYCEPDYLCSRVNAVRGKDGKCKPCGKGRIVYGGKCSLTTTVVDQLGVTVPEGADGVCTGGRFFSTREGQCLCPSRKPFWTGEFCTKQRAATPPPSGSIGLTARVAIKFPGGSCIASTIDIPLPPADGVNPVAVSSESVSGDLSKSDSAGETLSDGFIPQCSAPIPQVDGITPASSNETVDLGNLSDKLKPKEDEPPKVSDTVDLDKLKPKEDGPPKVSDSVDLDKLRPKEDGPPKVSDTVDLDKLRPKEDEPPKVSDAVDLDKLRPKDDGPPKVSDAVDLDKLRPKEDGPPKKTNLAVLEKLCEKHDGGKKEQPWMNDQKMSDDDLAALKKQAEKLKGEKEQPWMNDQKMSDDDLAALKKQLQNLIIGRQPWASTDEMSATYKRALKELAEEVLEAMKGGKEDPPKMAGNAGLKKLCEKLKSNKEAAPSSDIAVATERPKSNSDDGDAEADLGLVKAEERVVLLVLKGDETGEAVTGAVVKLLDEAPELPVAETADPALTSTENYTADAAAGPASEGGEIAIAVTAATDGSDTVSVGQVGGGQSAAAATTGKATVRQDVPVDQQTFEQVVVIGAAAASAAAAAKAGLPAELLSNVSKATHGETADEVLGAGDAAKSAFKGSKTCVARSFAIGKVPVYVVQVPRSRAPTFKRNVARAGGYSIETDLCRKKEQADDPHFNGTGLWGQKFDKRRAATRAGGGLTDVLTRFQNIRTPVSASD